MTPGFWRLAIRRERGAYPHPCRCSTGTGLTLSIQFWRMTAQTRSRMRLSLAGCSLPTARCTQDSLAVTTRWGKAKLARANPPPASKSAGKRGTASGCPAAWLVIWQRIRSPLVSDATTSAGRTFALERSVNGNGTTTTSPLTNRAMPLPPPGCSSRRPKRIGRAGAGSLLLRRARSGGPSGRQGNQRPAAARLPARSESPG